MHQGPTLTDSECKTALETYSGKYQPALTLDLDNRKDSIFSQATINEIVLWKVNRYASLTDDAVRRLNELRLLKPKQHKLPEVHELLRILLDPNQKGVDLAMASTFLRFRNPEVFQIIDKRAYRKLTGHPLPVARWSAVDDKIAVYMDYLDRVWTCFESLRNDCPSLDYKDMDRLLYQLDKDEKRPLKD